MAARGISQGGVVTTLTLEAPAVAASNACLSWTERGLSRQSLPMDQVCGRPWSKEVLQVGMGVAMSLVYQQNQTLALMSRELMTTLMMTCVHSPAKKPCPWTGMRRRKGGYRYSCRLQSREMKKASLSCTRRNTDKVFALPVDSTREACSKTAIPVPASDSRPNSTKESWLWHAD